MKKVIGIIVLVAIVLFVSTELVFAAYQKWTTSLSISAGSSLTGSKRSHYYDTQEITFYWTEVGYIDDTDPYMTVSLYKKGLFSYSIYSKQTVSASTYTLLTSLVYPDSGSGKYYFYFYTGTSSKPTGYFKADPVYVESYS